MTPFFGDAAVLQSMVDHHLEEGTFPTVGHPGSKKVHYGPTALWFYLPVRYFTDQLIYPYLLHVSGFVLAFVLIFLAVRMTLSTETALWAFLLMSSSPYLFQYSRTLWDNTFQVICTAWTAFFLAMIDQEKEISRRTYLLWIGLGVSTGLTFNTHLMSLPVHVALAITLLFVFYFHFQKKPLQTKITLLGCTALGFFAISTCYLIYLIPALQTSPSPWNPSLAGLWKTIPRAFQATTEYFSTRSMTYFLDSGNKGVRHEMGWLPGLFVEVDLSWALRWAGWFMLFATAWKLAKRKIIPPTLLIWGMFVLLFQILYVWALQLHTSDFSYSFSPHHYMATWWIMFVFAALAISNSQGIIKRVLQFCAIATALVNFSFVAAAHRLIVKNHGTQGIHYGVPHSLTRKAMKEVCFQMQEAGEDKAILTFFHTPAMVPDPFVYHVSKIALCKGKNVSFVQDPYPHGKKETPVYRLLYKDPPSDRRPPFWGYRDAQLRVERIPPQERIH